MSSHAAGRQVANQDLYIKIVPTYGNRRFSEWIRDSGPDFVQRILTNSEGEKLGGRPRTERIRMALAHKGRS